MKTFEPDQLVLVQYGNGGPWRLRRYSFLDDDEHETQDGSVWDDEHILPYSDNEHLLGTTDSSTPKWEPTPGELVAVRDAEGEEWVARIFRYRDTDSFACDNENTRIGVCFWRECEPLRDHFAVPEG